MEEVDAAAKREGKSTSAWLRDVALQAARPIPDTTELVLAEVAATRYMLLNRADAGGGAQDSRDGGLSQAADRAQTAPGFRRG